MMKTSRDVLILSSLFIASGVHSIILSLKRFKLRRQIANIPTSKIKSAPINELVELHCQVTEDPVHEYISPLSKKRCSGYIWIFSKMVRKRNNKYHWEEVFRYFSHNYLLLEDIGDAESQAAVRFDHCQFNHINPSIVIEYKSSKHGSPEEVLSKLQNNQEIDFSEEGFSLIRGNCQIKEIAFRPGRYLYLIGTTFFPNSLQDGKRRDLKGKKFGDQNHVEERNKKWDRFMKSEKVLKNFDKNQDGMIDQDEEKEIIQRLTEDYKKHAPKLKSKYDFSKIKLALKRSKTRNQIFDSPDIYVSALDEKSNLNRLLYAGLAYFFLGAVSLTGGILALLYQFVLHG